MIAISTGIPVKSLDALTSTNDTSGTKFAVAFKTGPSLGRTVTWQTVFDGSPSVASYQLQGALNNVEAEYAILDSSTATAGELRTLSPVNVRFIRVRQVTRTGATSVTATVMAS